ncbi:PREDICTED: LOW QUALITY PROTEIN: testis-expressed sequence 22 protein [Colobus angolensis palliatus]|uniref:LOW QUALITY PROTEIN: testis-expressed sequence 22 protein n=1 Tax=Colobus angolensis palliatus TaxID=336983 RepID=UPI0005F3AA44|nr:PREDICTED: LOW QUALITY PROTEIN: testis-expressed sequence 22 protein [Colobus angolensis palliatus]
MWGRRPGAFVSPAATLWPMKIPTGWPDQRGRHSSRGRSQVPCAGLGGSRGHSPQSVLAPVLCVGSTSSTQEERGLPDLNTCPVSLLPSKPVLWGLHRRSWGSWGPPRDPGRTAGLLAWFHEMEHYIRLCSESWKRRAGWASSLGWRGLYPSWPERWPIFLICDSLLFLATPQVAEQGAFVVARGQDVTWGAASGPRVQASEVAAVQGCGRAPPHQGLQVHLEPGSWGTPQGQGGISEVWTSSLLGLEMDSRKLFPQGKKLESHLSQEHRRPPLGPTAARGQPSTQSSAQQGLQTQDWDIVQMVAQLVSEDVDKDVLFPHPLRSTESTNAFQAFLSRRYHDHP